MNDLDKSNVDIEVERAILIGLNLTSIQKKQSDIDIEESMAELKELATAAGAEVIATMVQNKSSIDPATFLGSGKIEEIREYAEKMDATMIVFNDELSGAQIRNIENIVGKKIIDRTVLILDIFAQRALSKEGKLQVELAQLRYRLPRLYGMGGEMSRTGAGIGTRGPGEQKLEKDKRHILNRQAAIRRELKEIAKNRDTQRNQRKKNKIPIVALVGYTNAGKSTLLNEIIKTHPDYEREKDVFVRDMLFATLDVSLRKAMLPNKREFLIVDTVGFVNKLPHDLIDAFKSTLEEVKYADLILHLIDSSNESSTIQIETTKEVLKDLGCDDKKTITVYNKIDKLDIDIYPKNTDDTVYISAKKGLNLSKLMNMIQKSISSDEYIVNLLLPFNRGDVFSYLNEKYIIDKFEYTEEGIDLVVGLDKTDFNIYKKYIKLKK